MGQRIIRHGQPMPPGTILGRANGRGDAQALTMAQLRRLGLAPGAAAAAAVTQSLKAGSNITLTDNGDGTVTVASTAGGSSLGYIGVPAGFSPHNNNSSGTGFFIGRVIVVPKATTLNSIVLPVFTTNALTVVTPAIYGVTAGTYDIAALLASGAGVTGVTKGIQTLPLSAGLAVTQGQIIWVGVTISGAALVTVQSFAQGSVFFASTATPVNPAAAATYDGTAASMWASE
jgi:hypothetical protein